MFYWYLYENKGYVLATSEHLIVCSKKGKVINFDPSKIVPNTKSHDIENKIPNWIKAKMLLLLDKNLSKII